MGIWDAIRGELIDIIEWLDDTPDTIVWRYPRGDNEIKNGAKLIVRESQAAAFVSEGSLADMFLQPGTYTLETRNLPILAKLKGWKYGFESPFKAEVYFVSLRTFTGKKWGTKNPIMLRDPEFGPVRLRAFGTFSLRVSQPFQFLKEVVGTGSRFSVEQIDEQLRDMMVSRFADVLGESRIPILDLASNYDELSKFITSRVKDDFERFGLEVVTLHVENISLPPEVEAALDKRTSMGIVGNLQAYTQFQAANAMEAAAKNPSGLAGGGVGVGLGVAMGQAAIGAMNQMGQGQQQPPAIQNPPGGLPPSMTPPALPGAGGPSEPPRMPASASYFVALSGRQSGPFDRDRLSELSGAGVLTRQTLVWKPGMASWSAAGEVEDLAGLFAAVPPPLPPLPPEARR